MRIALCQTPIIWEKAGENIAHYNSVLTDIFKDKDSGTDIVVFPEFFTYGFTMNKEMAESTNGPSLRWLREKSREFNVAIASTIPIKEEDRFYNRAYFVTPDGSEHFYNKRHLFSYGGEDSIFTPGTSHTIFYYKGWNISLQICYDLRFPVWSRNTDLSYDLIINMANWPSVRESVVEPLVRARAIENLSFYAFVNRTGDDLSSRYNAVGMIADYKGVSQNAVRVSKDFNYQIFTLDLDGLKSFRKKFEVWRDADKFKIIF
ncbi:MAG: nitrilase-related carbon-nitrogen hydrolase [Rikenellaceae bacterium]